MQNWVPRKLFRTVIELMVDFFLFLRITTRVVVEEWKEVGSDFLEKKGQIIVLESFCTEMELALGVWIMHEERPERNFLGWMMGVGWGAKMAPLPVIIISFWLKKNLPWSQRYIKNLSQGRYLMCVRCKTYFDAYNLSNSTFLDNCILHV